MSSDLNLCRRRITVLITETNITVRALAAKGIIDIDLEDRMEAMDIINRIERHMIANMPQHSEAAE